MIGARMQAGLDHLDQGADFARGLSSTRPSPAEAAKLNSTA